MRLLHNSTVTPAIRVADINCGGLENRMPAHEATAKLLFVKSSKTRTSPSGLLRSGHDNNGCNRILNVAGLLAFLIVLLCAVPAYAMTHPDERLDDPVLAMRADNIARQIRCVVCQNQSIHDSDTEIAQGLRTLIAVQLKDGKTDEEIIDYIHERYGDFVLMKPPVKPMTWGLWFGPILILLSGGLLAMRMMKIKKRRRRS